jgi:hypothetical protein
MREHCRDAVFWIASLRAGSMDVNKVVVTGVFAWRTRIRRATCAGTVHALTTHTQGARSTTTTTGTSLALRWLHLIQLPHLIGRQNTSEFRLYVGLQVGQLPLLIGGQVQLFLCKRG